MKLKKLFIIAIVLVAFMLQFTGCSNSTAETFESSTATSASQATTAAAATTTAAGDDITIGFSFPTLQEERWAIEKDIAVEMSKTLGVNLLVQDANTDATLQNQQVDNLITQGVDALIIGAADIEASASAVAAAKAEGIPVISILRMINSDELDCFVGYNWQEIGSIIARAAMEAVPEGNYVFLRGDEGDSVCHEMKKGMDSALKAKFDDGKIKNVFDQFTQNWEPANALANMENCLTQMKNDVQCVIGNNDHVAGAAIQALTAQGINDKVFVTGMDGDLAACQRIVEGTQDTTIVFLHDVLIKAALEAAIDLAKGNKPAGVNGTASNDKGEIPAVLLAADLVNKDNMIDKIVKTGVHKLDDVYANIPKAQWPKQ